MRPTKYVFATGMSGSTVRKTTIVAYSAKQAKFLLYNMARANGIYVPCAELDGFSGTYPGEKVAIWDTDMQAFKVIIVR